ncbi:type II toxin-antitoxin system death-on-curing family toxin [Staphylococcus pettenkoferi]|uniref:type II toxin-antitoxin system death-on-curing family toxin n=1 Tax=Staphylococcus pettenkoferi TaxID=170573 RepID=UPI0025535A07|nr:type II toxin-antitoxin system death-on-curing family toxin [Staphylococcus pettenkoferi]MDK7284468.1 type II toxin-antitoxin system death-on-curing family toxin [Staphylococcus pettenkoferi]
MRYLTEKDIITLNVYIIKTYSPNEQIGVREPNALNMLVHAPQQHVFDKEQYPTISLKTANLVRNLVKKHVFYNGNKRTAFMVMLVFLKLNGYRFTIDDDKAVAYMVRIATDNLQEQQIATWIEQHMSKVSQDEAD